MIERARPLLGTIVAIRVDDDAGDSAHRAIDAAFESVALIDRLMSYQQAGSELSRLNREAARNAITVSAHTFRVLHWAQRLSRDTGGRFDAVVPHRCAHVAPRQADLLLLSGRRVRYRRALRLDLSGIAKGYAVDLAMLVLRRHGVRSAVINAGGDLRAMGRSALPVGLRVAGPSAQTAVIELDNGALASSAGAAGLTVAVVARRCLLADALTKVVLADGGATAAVAGILARFGARGWYHEPARGWQALYRVCERAKS